MPLLKPGVGALLLMGGLTACQTLSADEPAALARVADDAGAEPHPALAFAQAACGGCHAVEHPGILPNVAAPLFAAIANREGLSKETLTTWLRNAHNYPEEMDFDLDPPQVQALVDYILTLQDPAYRPPIG